MTCRLGRIDLTLKQHHRNGFEIHSHTKGGLGVRFMVFGLSLALLSRVHFHAAKLWFAGLWRLSCAGFLTVKRGHIFLCLLWAMVYGGATEIGPLRFAFRPASVTVSPATRIAVYKGFT